MITYDSSSLESDEKVQMSKFILSLCVSFVLVGAGCELRRRAATLPLLFEKEDVPILSLLFYCRRGGGGVEDGL